MKFKRFIPAFLLIISTFVMHACTLKTDLSSESGSNPSSSQNSRDYDSTLKKDNKEDAVVRVDDEYIYDDEIRAVFFQYLGNQGISYSDIVENTIDEIVARSYAKELGVCVSDSELAAALREYKFISKDIYAEALKTYGEEALKEKMKERMLFIAVKNKVLSEELKIDSELLKSFKSQKEFHGILDKYSDAELKERMKNEIKDYAFSLWVKEKRKTSDIEYLKLYDRYKKDFLVFNSSGFSESKLDAKEKALEIGEREEILKALAIPEKFKLRSGVEVLVKDEGKDEYNERAYVKLYFEDPGKKNVNLDILITDRDEIAIDYGVGLPKKSVLCGLNVELSKCENLNIDDKILLRAVFKCNKKAYILEASNMDVSEFLKMLLNLIYKLTQS